MYVLTEITNQSFAGSVTCRCLFPTFEEPFDKFLRFARLRGEAESGKMQKCIEWFLKSGKRTPTGHLW